MKSVISAISFLCVAVVLVFGVFFIKSHYDGAQQQEIENTAPQQVTERESSLYIDALKLEYEGLYTGFVDERGRAHGQGLFTAQDKNFSYEGLWEEGAPTEGYMVCDEMPFSFGGTQYECHFEGQVSEGIPNGEGLISHDKKDVCLRFEGRFDMGDLAEGSFESNIYVLTLPGGNSFTGDYKGDWQDNSAHGHGSFSCPDRNSFGIDYEGEWKYGKPDGQGKLTLHETDTVQEGNFYKGEFYPSPREYFAYLSNKAKDRICEYDGALDYLETNIAKFMEHELSEDMPIDTNFNFKRLVDYPEENSHTLFYADLTIASTPEIYVQSGDTMTSFYAKNWTGDYIRIFMYGRHDDYELDDVSGFNLLPIFASDETLTQTQGGYSRSFDKKMLWCLAIAPAEEGEE